MTRDTFRGTQQEFNKAFGFAVFNRSAGRCRQCMAPLVDMNGSTQCSEHPQEHQLAETWADVGRGMKSDVS